eukprot:gene13413-19265_t
MSQLDEILEQNKGNLLLKCMDGELLVHKDVMAIASRKVAKYLESEAAAVLPELSVSTDTVAQWKMVLGQLYPICPRPELGTFELEEMIQVIGIAHEWELANLLSRVLSSLVVKLPPSFNMRTENLLECLFTEEINVKEFKDACLLFLSQQAQAGAGNVDQELDQDDECFAFDTPAWKVTSPGAGALGGWEEAVAAAKQVPMSQLGAGDFVLSMNEAGSIFHDRVVRNVHVNDKALHELLVFHYSLGSLSVTPGHSVYVNGRYMAAADARVGDKLTAAVEGGVTEVAITHITQQQTRIINPIPSSGRILAGQGSVLVASVPYTSGNYAMHLASLPGFWKLASRLMPDAYQDSTFIEGVMSHPVAMFVANMGGSHLPLPAAALAMLLYDFATFCIFLLGQPILLGGTAFVALSLLVVSKMPSRP